MTNQINIGVIGTSWWAELAYLPILRKYERVNLVAVCGRNRQKTEDIATKYTIPKFYTDYEKMIQQAQLDAIVVSTPDDTHYDMVMKALDNGLHVLCEKPVALDANHALKMYNKAMNAKVKHMVNYSHHWFPNLQQAKQILDNNHIGDVYQGNFHWLAGYGLDRTYQWRFDAERANGILADLGSHLIHLALWFLGDVKAVTGQLGYHVKREGVYEQLSNPANDSANFVLEFTNGAIIQFFVTAVAHVINTSMSVSVELDGETGRLESKWFPGDAPIRTSISIKRSDTHDIQHETSQVDFMDFFDTNSVGVRLFVDCILDDTPITPSLFEGYKVQQIINAVMDSHESGRRIDLKQEG